MDIPNREAPSRTKPRRILVRPANKGIPPNHRIVCGTLEKFGLVRELSYTAAQKELFVAALRELRAAAPEHLSRNQHDAAALITAKYKEKGLLYEIPSLCKGTWEPEKAGLMSAMVAKRYLEENGFSVAVSEINYKLTLYGDQLKSQDEATLKMECGVLYDVFGGKRLRDTIEDFNKKRDLLALTTTGGEPRLFVHKPVSSFEVAAFFVSPTANPGRTSRLQAVCFTSIKKYLCSVEEMRVVSSRKQFPSTSIFT